VFSSKISDRVRETEQKLRKSRRELRISAEKNWNFANANPNGDMSNKRYRLWVYVPFPYQNLKICQEVSEFEAFCVS
jgi:hypothetical protein